MPREARATFAAVSPIMVATWSMGALYLSLGPSIAAGVLGLTSHLAGAAVVSAFTGAGAVAAVVARNRPARAVMLSGAAVLAVGTTVTVLGVHLGVTSLFLVGTVVAGTGFGTGFLGSFRLLAALAQPWLQRAELLAAVFVVSYLAFSLPAIVAGLLVPVLGLQEPATGYAVVDIVARAAGAARGRRAAGRRPPLLGRDARPFRLKGAVYASGMSSGPGWVAYVVGTPVLTFLVLGRSALRPGSRDQEVETRSKREETMRDITGRRLRRRPTGHRDRGAGGAARFRPAWRTPRRSSSRRRSARSTRILRRSSTSWERTPRPSGSAPGRIRLGRRHPRWLECFRHAGDGDKLTHRIERAEARAMAKQVAVSQAQKSAAQAMVKRGAVTGRFVSSSVRKIADAKPIGRAQS